MAIYDAGKACLCQSLGPSTPCPSTDPETGLTSCLQACNLKISGASSINPCTDSGFVDLTGQITYPPDTSGSPVIEIAWYSDNLTNVQYNSGPNTISFDSQYEVDPDNYSSVEAKIIYKVTDGFYSVTAEIWILFEQLGDPNGCNADTEDYNPCTGNCDAKAINIIVT